MNDERRSILEMVSKGKLTVEEAEQLLHELEGAASTPASAAAVSNTGAPRRARWLRVTVEKETEAGRKREVNVRIPAALVRAGVRLGSLIPGADSRFVAGGFGNVAKLDSKQLDELLDTMGEMTVDVEDGKSQVRIFCE